MSYSIIGFFEISEDMVQIMLVLEVLFTPDFKVEDFDGAPSSSEPSLFFRAITKTLYRTAPLRTG